MPARTSHRLPIPHCNECDWTDCATFLRRTSTHGRRRGARLAPSTGWCGGRSAGWVCPHHRPLVAAWVTDRSHPPTARTTQAVLTLLTRIHRYRPSTNLNSGPVGIMEQRMPALANIALFQIA